MDTPNLNKRYFCTIFVILIFSFNFKSKKEKSAEPFSEPVTNGIFLAFVPVQLLDGSKDFDLVRFNEKKTTQFSSSSTSWTEYVCK